ncbi:hypothetical protein Holit_00179 [Hollandina sp. SP2]
MEAELTEHLGYEKHDQGAKTIADRCAGKTTKELRTDSGPMSIEVPIQNVNQRFDAPSFCSIHSPSETLVLHVEGNRDTSSELMGINKADQGLQ